MAIKSEVLFLFILFPHLFIYFQGGKPVRARAHVWWSEYNLWEWILSFCVIGSGIDYHQAWYQEFYALCSQGHLSRCPVSHLCFPLLKKNKKQKK